MPPPVYRPFRFPTDRWELFRLGRERIDDWCRENGLDPVPVQAIESDKWYFGSTCAFYRPDDERTRKVMGGDDDLNKLRSKGYGWGINVCVAYCAAPCGLLPSRAWSWPGSVTDRTVYGVLAHELGHHVDWLSSEERGTYFGDYSVKLRAESREPPLTSYCPNDAEWFAETFRVFVTNPGLLAEVRPKAYRLIRERWNLVGTEDWRKALGGNAPERVVRNLEKKGAK